MSEYLYPTLDDPTFNSKIASKKEFNNTQYDDYKLKKVEEESERLCSMKMELSPHQIFVRNFLSVETPYKGLLLYHGLGSGKTCSAITICEEFRMNSMNYNKDQRILIIASKNVQDNFRIQLFDERKLELINGLWNVTGCVSQTLANEVNPTFMKNIPKYQIIKQINGLIDKNYMFMGYRQFGNSVSKKIELLRRQHKESVKNIKTLENMLLKQLFSNRLIVIDEVQNIRTNKGKEDMEGIDADEKVFQLLMSIVRRAVNLKLVLMSATPMYDSFEEILSIINLLNANDGRSLLSKSEVFDIAGNFKERGKELFIQKITGYVSVVRGENPYLFPYRIYPLLFDSSRSMLNKSYPSVNLLGNTIDSSEYIENLDLYTVEKGEYQSQIVGKYIESLTKKNIKQLGYNVVEPGVQLLTMTFPSLKDESDLRNHYGKKGLDNILTYVDTTLDKKVKNEKKNFEYKPDVLTQFGRIFSLTEIGKYSNKLYHLGLQIKESTGIIMIYSRYIEGGVIPIALMLEELGFKRYGNTVSLFKEVPTEGLDALTMRPQSEVGSGFHQATYSMITGDQALSNANRDEIKALTEDENKEGKLIKVVIVTLAGSEGIDLKCIRQVHIVDPWYNIFRIEQLIGRAVRTCSHKKLPFKKRNVEIFLYTTYTDEDIEHADLNLYRRSYAKMKQIGIISRVLKEHAIDCHLNIKQTNFSVEKFNQTVSIELSTRDTPTIEYQVGDKQFSHLCDFMSECEYTCKPNSDIGEISTEIRLPFLVLNVDKIVERIKELFYEYVSFDKEQLIKLIQVHREYPIEQIDLALDKLIHDETEYLTNANGTIGRLVNVGKFYRFQSLELLESNASHFDISRPIEFKPPGKLFAIGNKEPDKSSYLIQNNESMYSAAKELIKDMSVSYHILEMYVDYKDKKIKAKSLNWYQQAAIAIHVIVKTMAKNAEKKVSGQFKEDARSDVEKTILPKLYRVSIHHYIEQLKLEQHITLLQYIEIEKDNIDLMGIVKEYYRDKQFEYENNTYILLYNESAEGVMILKKDTRWQIYDDIVGDVIKERAKEKKVMQGDYGSISGYLYYHASKGQQYILKLIKNGEISKKSLGFWCKDKGEALRQGFLSSLLKLGNLETLSVNKKLQNVHTCILLEIVLRFYQENKILEDGLEKQWFFDPVHIYLQGVSKI